MGTALASFVGGALIVFTMFDETQVTKVDSLQGSIKELHSKVRYWEGYKGHPDANQEWLENAKTQSSEALKESKNYLIYLEKESLKKEEEKNQFVVTYQGQRKNMLLNAIALTESNVSNLEHLQSRLERPLTRQQAASIEVLIEEAIPLTLQTKLEKARFNSFELISRLESRSIETKNSKDHYRKLMYNITGVNNCLVTMSPTLPLNFLDKEFGLIEREIVPLTKQTPYTLLMMRVVEIGLPFLLCLFSLFFVLQYSLTEKRSHEIKDLLKQRNLERPKETTYSKNSAKFLE
jgi:hypothetical protein